MVVLKIIHYFSGLLQEIEGGKKYEDSEEIQKLKKEMEEMKIENIRLRSEKEEEKGNKKKHERKIGKY